MYEELYQAWKKEKESLELQQLPKDFYARLSEYIKRIREESRMLDKKTAKARLIRIEYENVKKLITELIRLRIRKILDAISSEKIISKNYLTQEEERIGKKAFPISDYYQDLMKKILQGQVFRAEAETERPKKIVVRFLTNAPAIVGTDLKAYGPFQKEDVASLPAENARALIRQGIAAEIEVS